MPATYSSRLRALQQEYNTNPESWGGELNTGAIERLDEAWAVTEITVGAEVTLTSQNALADQSRGFVLIASGDGGFAVITPAVDKPYLVINDCTADITMKPTGGTAATIRAGTQVLYTTNEAGTAARVVDPTLDKIKTAAADVALGGFKITGLGTPTSGTDAATKTYADLMLPLAGGTMSGAIAMGTAKITGLGDPTADQDAATKAYVVSQTATSVAAAAASASAASTSETNAATSETKAATSASNAATSETNAAASAVDAAASAASVEPLPIQTGNSGKYLTTNGTATSWGTIATPTYGSISPYSAISASLNPAVAFTRYLVDTTSAVTVTLPGSPTVGDWIEIIRDGANNVTVGRNGNNIAGLVADLTIDTDGYGAILLYTASGWIVSARVWA